MGKVLCYIYPEMADFEVSLLLHQLRKAGGREIVAVSEGLEEVTAQSGLRYLPDRRIAEIQDLEGIEALLIPGGPICNEQNAICPLARRMLESGKLVAAVCFGPQFLGRAGMLDRYRYTTSCSVGEIRRLGCADPFNRANFVHRRTVADRNLITAQGYAFVDFAMEVCRYLAVFENEEQAYERLGRVKESAPD